MHGAGLLEYVIALNKTEKSESEDDGGRTPTADSLGGVLQIVAVPSPHQIEVGLLLLLESNGLHLKFADAANGLSN